MRHISSLSLAFALALPHAALAFSPPAGCETVLTVQSKNCQVSNIYHCDDNPGGFFEAVHGADGPQSVVSYDAQYQWLDAHYLWDDSRETFVPPAEDAIDLPALLSEGVDTFRFQMHRTSPSEDRTITIVGVDVMSGKTTRIDGKRLEVVDTDLQILAEDGSVEYNARGEQYLDRSLGLFFLGRERVFADDGTHSDYDNSPVDFIHPGEPGFGDTVPLYECQEVEAALPWERHAG